ncbi:MAG TPA: MotA/TolQ/ExbB proton channel family protein [Bacillota bacterium]|nr:MotA/TolQ/ExbB proton channel family protein [Bacillota bacterium]
MMRLIKEGGFFIFPLLLCSVVGFAIIIERLIVYRKIMKQPLILWDRPDDIVARLRRHLVTLHTIITISPMLGLLGTVTGLMKSFYLLGIKTVSYNPQEISLGISEALITTAVGLVIAVVATVFYNYFNAVLESYVDAYNAAITALEDE